MHETHIHGAVRPERRSGRLARILGAATVAGQFAVAAVQAVAGHAEQAWAAGQHALHDFGDGIGYVPQVLAVNRPERSKERAQKIRKATYWFISASSAAVAVKTGSDALQGVLFGREVSTESHASTYAVGASLALNTSVAGTWYWYLKRQGLTKTVAAYDLLKHARTDVGTALLAMAGVMAQRYYPLADEMAATFGAGVTTALFRPTTKNLKQAHNHVPGGACGDAHAHEHEYVGRHRRDEEAQVGRRQANEPKKRWRTALAAGVAAVSMLLGGGSVHGEKPVGGDVLSGSPAYVPAVASPAPQLPIMAPAETVPLPLNACVTVKKGDSMWRMAEVRITQATGKPANAALTAAVTRMAADSNRDIVPNPHLIFPGDCITLPSLSVIAGLQSA